MNYFNENVTRIDAIVLPHKRTTKKLPLVIRHIGYCNRGKFEVQAKFVQNNKLKRHILTSMEKLLKWKCHWVLHKKSTKQTNYYKKVLTLVTNPYLLLQSRQIKNKCIQ